MRNNDIILTTKDTKEIKNLIINNNLFLKRIRKELSNIQWLIAENESMKEKLEKLQQDENELK